MTPGGPARARPAVRPGRARRPTAASRPAGRDGARRGRFDRPAAGVLRRRPPGGAARWTRTNHAGAPVTLLEGPAYAVGAVGGALATGAPRGRDRRRRRGRRRRPFGALDDLAGRPAQQGAAGPPRRARPRSRSPPARSRSLGLGADRRSCRRPWSTARAAGRVPGALRRRARRAAVVAGSANLLNLLDLRPGPGPQGRAAARAPLPPRRRRPSSRARWPPRRPGAALGALPGRPRRSARCSATPGPTAPARSLGAAPGRAHRPARPAGRAGRAHGADPGLREGQLHPVIESTPGLRELDALGRRPAGDRASGAGEPAEAGSPRSRGGRAHRRCVTLLARRRRLRPLAGLLATRRRRPVSATLPDAPTRCPTSLYEVAAGGALAAVRACRCIAGQLGRGDRERGRPHRLGAAHLGRVAARAAGRAAGRCSPCRSAGAARGTAGAGAQSTLGAHGCCWSSPRRCRSTASASCSPACCRHTAASSRRPSRRCCPASW